MINAINIADYVKEGAVHGKIYTDPAIFKMEIDKVYGSTWVYVGHESEIANPGDYKTTKIGSQPVVVTRSADSEEINVVLNRCRHRGASVCQDECGNAHVLRCAYHGWTYSNNGKLLGAPFQDGYGEEFNREEMGLIRVPRVDSYRGFIFASLNEKVKPLKEHLGNALPYIDYVADSGPEGIELSAGKHKYFLNANWKFQVENTIDPYHLGFVHKTFFDIVAKRTGEKMKFAKMHKEEKVSDLGNGHSLYELAGDLNIGALPFNLIIFPNLALLGSQVRVIQPVSVERTEVALYPIMLKGVSKEVNSQRLRTHEGFYGPAGFGSPDDVEVAFDRVKEGLKAEGHEWLVISRGLNREQVDENGIITANSSDEVSTRAIYKEWKRLMEA
ncbi:aromatic ring-hydroxylating dioxygenase subunit alpha [Bacillus sp. OK048]|uniref:aromatic ring-hydroxylating oxygenase subunit alpha n=1 Tax=Bacillus sp. OK048 TaxID=1882761 RepID=UPI0008828B91|nr:Rieske 2Fe-2S domain-containing protein [Bacillus sp. OK048]SDM41046.1 Phenylpropionate dioxygenase, large terminal subunit [Bacillus sp. OK048]